MITQVKLITPSRDKCRTARRELWGRVASHRRGLFSWWNEHVAYEARVVQIG